LHFQSWRFVGRGFLSRHVCRIKRLT
jgi:hypothetical protein